MREKCVAVHLVGSMKISLSMSPNEDPFSAHVPLLLYHVGGQCFGAGGHFNGAQL